MIKKHQWIIITSLNAVILLMAGGLVLTFFLKKQPAGVKPVDPPVEYSRLRDSELSLSPNLEWEQHIGGTGNEKPVSCFKMGEKLYVFGNTDTSNLDMSGITKGFLAILTDAGRTVDFIAVADEELRCATVAEGGFLVCSTTRAILVSLDGALRGSYGFGENDVVKKAILSDDGYIIASEISGGGIYGKLRVTRLSRDLKLIYASVSDEIYNLSLLDMYCLNEKTLVFCNSSGVKNMLSAGVFTPGASPVFTHVPLDESYTAYGVSPCDGGYTALAVDSLGRAFMLKLNYAFACVKKLAFNIGDCLSGEMAYNGDGFIIFVRRNLVNFYAMIDFAVTKADVGSVSADYTLISDGNAVRALGFGDKLKLGIIGDGRLNGVVIGDISCYGGTMLSGYIFVEGDGKMGGRDVIIMKLRN